MDQAIFFDTMRQALRIAVTTSLPILSVALVVGLAIGLIQALTSIQEMTLTFVPKLGAIVAVFWITMDYMTEGLRGFFVDGLLPLIAGS